MCIRDRDVSKEWLDFRRNQFPAGSRIQTWELDDPRNTLKEARKLDYIDDSGRFHVRQSDGGECVLTLGEEMFSVHPPESTQLKLYMPLTASFYARNEWGDWDETGEEWDGRTLLDYEEMCIRDSAKGVATASSDVDLLVDSGLRGLAFFGLLEQVTEALDTPVDLIDVSQVETGSEIAREIQKSGVALFEQ